MENKELIETLETENPDPRKSAFVVHTYRDVNLMKSFIKFDTRVRHPRVQFNMFIIGLFFYTLAWKVEGIELPGLIICYVMGTLLIALAVFRHNMSLAAMRKNPQVHENEELYYYFGNSKIRSTVDGREENLGFYKEVYKVWEDESNFFIGLESEDLLVLPKGAFEVGDFREFCDFILEKTGANYRWTPATLSNKMKDLWMKIRMKVSNVDQENAAKARIAEKKNKKK